MSYSLTPIALSHLTVHADNVRQDIDQNDITRLAASIQSVGLINPLACIKTGKTYGVIAGGAPLGALQQLANDNKLPENYIKSLT